MKKTTYLFDVPVHDLRSPDIFVRIVVLLLSLVPIWVMDSTSSNTIMLWCDICDYFGFSRELAENSTSTKKSSMTLHTMAKAINIPHDGRPAFGFLASDVDHFVSVKLTHHRVG